mgnify:CR=1 FL=1
MKGLRQERMGREKGSVERGVLDDWPEACWAAPVHAYVCSNARARGGVGWQGLSVQRALTSALGACG